MPKRTQLDRLKRWTARVDASDKIYKDWASTFKVDKLEPYYQGRQWPEGEADRARDTRYVINLFFPTIEIDLPNLLFHYPKAKIRPQAPRANDRGSDLADRAALLQAVAQAQIERKDLHFLEETSLARSFPSEGLPARHWDALAVRRLGR